MKKCLILLILLLLLWSCNQSDCKYPSSELEAYEFDNEYVLFELPKEEEVLNYKNDFFDFKEIYDFEPYRSNAISTPSEDTFYYECYVLKNHDFETGSIGGISKTDIWKQGSRGDTLAILYRYRDFGYNGISLAFSVDNGNSWEYYYTGITQGKPLYVKWYSKYPLIDANGNIGIEACLLRQFDDAEEPDIRHVADTLVKDGLFLMLDLATLRRDTDGDGLTDIVETRLHTDLNNPDTDNDGIPDNLDLTPRVSAPRTEKTLALEAAINKDRRICFEYDPHGAIIPMTEEQGNYYVNETTDTYMVVTDDENLYGVRPNSSLRLVFVTKEENEAFFGKFDDGMKRYFVTPLCKVDHRKDTYIFSVSSMNWHNAYVAKKRNRGWDIRFTSITIE